MSNITLSLFKFYNSQEGGLLMDENLWKKIESILAKGDRVELVPVKNGVKVLRVRRDEVKA